MQKSIFSSLLLLMLLIFSMIDAQAEIKELEIAFYGEQIHLNYESSLADVNGVRFSEQEFSQFLQQKESKDFNLLLSQFRRHRQEMNLNDWMYFELLHTVVNQMLASGNDYEKTLLSYLLLSKSGYDSKITFLNHKMWLNVYTEDKLYEISTILLGNKNFVNLTAAINKKDDFVPQIYVLDYEIASTKRPFSFKLSSLPNIAPRTKLLNVKFDFKDQPISLDVEIDLNLIELINNYPIFDEAAYVKTPLSPTAIASLQPQLKKYMEGMNEETKLEFLVSITRMAFNYKEDHDAFGRNKPMIAEELFFHNYSDCEDRCALFYNLNKITLDLPLLVVALPEHLSIAVGMENPPSQYKNVIEYNGRKYYFCDPTGPYNAHYIGSLPKEYQNSTYEILTTYK